MSRIVGGFLGAAALLVALFAVLFLGGLASAWWEVRREKRAGVPVTRPAWDRRDRARANGGTRALLRGYWNGLRAKPTDPGRCPVCAGPLSSDGSLCLREANNAAPSVKLHADHWMRGSL